MALLPGSRLGPYEVQAPLGAGGMGTVYRAFDATLQRPIAIKVLSEADEQARDKLLAEARAASALDHPNICTVYEVGEADARPYIVMALVEGKSLSELIPSDGLPPETVIRYGLQIADALAHAHEKGIIHRDLKSQNVVITPEGRAKVLDFGLATRLEQQDAEAVTVSMDTQADVGRITGTLAYMAPEVLRGEAATARSDIWALGVLLYEMAAGKLPFTGATRTDVVSAIVKEKPASLPATVSAGLRHLIQHCLTKEPAQRYPHPSAIQASLEAIQSDVAELGPGAGAPVSGARWGRAAGIAGLFLALGSAIYLSRSSPPSDEFTTISRLVNLTQVTRAAGIENFPTWSPDGDTLAYEANVTGTADVWVVQLGGGQPLNRTAGHAGEDRFPSWSPDGRQIAFLSTRDGGGIFVMPVLAGAPRRVATVSYQQQGAPQWSPDGTRLAFIGPDENGAPAVEMVVLATGESQRLALPGDDVVRPDLRWSPDGRYFAYVAGNHAYQANRLWLVRLAEGEAFPLTDGLTMDHSPSWSPDALTIYFVSNRGGSADLWQQRLDDDGRPVGDPLPVTAGVGVLEAAVAPDGSRVAYSKGGRVANVWRVPILADRPATWADAEQLTFDEAIVEMVDLSPDGERLLISSNRAGNPDLWMLPATGGEMQQLTADAGADWAPRWSPDGQRVVFYSDRSGNRDVWTMPVGGGPATQVTHEDAQDWYPDWSPDGRSIAFASRRGEGGLVTWVTPAQGGEARQLSEIEGNWPAWSADGEWIAVSRVAGGGLWRVPTSGGEAMALTTEPAVASRWSRDGREVYFVGGGERSGNLWAVSSGGGEIRALTDLTGKQGATGALALGTDGEYLYFTWAEDTGDIWVMDVVQDDP